MDKSARAGSLSISLLLVITATLTACSGGGDSNGSDSSSGGGGDAQEPQDYKVGGHATGPGSSQIELALSDGQTATVSDNGTFEFEDPLADDSGFKVRVSTQPEDPDLQCRVFGGQGIILGAPVNDITVRCGTPAPEVRSLEEAIQLSWQATGEVDIIFSSDPDCDWSNYSVCPDSGMISAASGGERTLPAAENNLPLDRTMYFVIESGDHISLVAPGKAWTTRLDGAVNALAEHNGTLYVGGEFTGRRPYTGGYARFDTVGKLHGPLPVLHDPSTSSNRDGVTAAIPDGEGGWYFGGEFKTVNGRDRTNLVHIDARGAITDWRTHLDHGEINAMALHRGHLYVAGELGFQGGGFGLLAAFDARTGTRLPWNPAPTLRTMHDLAIHKDKLYVGGKFEELAGEPRRGLAAFDLETRELTDWAPKLGKNGFPYATVFHIHQGKLYVGGNFNVIDGKSRPNLASFNLEDGTLTDWYPERAGFDTYTRVEAIAASSDTLFVGGFFESDSGTSNRTLVALDPDSGGLLGKDTELEGLGPVADIAHYDGTLYLAGGFSMLNGTPREHLIAIDAQTAARLDWGPQTNGRPTFIFSDNGSLHVGGSFSRAGGTPLPALQAYDAATAQPLDWTPQFDGKVDALEVHNDRLYVGGRFTEVEGQDRVGLAAYDVTTRTLVAWHLQAPLDRCTSTSYHPCVDHIAFANGNVYLNGYFRAAGGVERPGLASFDINTGALTDWNPATSANVRTNTNSMIAHEGTIYLGGDPWWGLGQGDITRDEVAALDATTGDLLPWEVTLNGYEDNVDGEEYLGINALLPFGEAVFVGGEFIEVNGQAIDHLVSVDSNNGAVLNRTPTMERENYSEIRALAEYNGIIYAGGQSFRSVGGQSRPSALFAFDASDGSLTSWAPDLQTIPDYPTPRTDALVARPEAIFAAGLYGVEKSERFRLTALDPVTGERIW